jgi:hypothetical protein
VKRSGRLVIARTSFTADEEKHARRTLPPAAPLAPKIRIFMVYVPPSIGKKRFMLLTHG